MVSVRFGECHTLCLNTVSAWLQAAFMIHMAGLDQ